MTNRVDVNARIQIIFFMSGSLRFKKNLCRGLLAIRMKVDPKGRIEEDQPQVPAWRTDSFHFLNVTWNKLKINTDL